MPPRPSTVCRRGHEKPLGEECLICKRAYNRAYMKRLREREKADRACASLRQLRDGRRRVA
jgi:hypothetical protein